MSVNPLEQINKIVANNPTAKSPSSDNLRKVAEQFEAVLLRQLTSAMNGSAEPDEDSLFGSDGGSGLAKQMFSEQLANTMASSGGIGLADMIMQKYAANQPKSNSEKPTSVNKPLPTVKYITENISAADNNQNRVSNFENKVERSENVETLENIESNKESRALTRPRIVPDSAIRKIDNPATNTEVLSNNSNNVASPARVSESVSVKSANTVSYQIPAKGRISSSFGTRFHPIDKKIKFHGGLDIAIPTGTQVKSAADGVVTFAGRKGGYGNVVIIEHPDGRETRYGHLDRILVSVGDPVSSGQEVAKSGSTGKSTGPHLHFEIRENGAVVNPFKILSNVLPSKADK